MKRKAFVVILALSIVCMFTLAGCSSGTPSPPITNQTKPAMEASIEKVFTVGSYDGSLLVINLNVRNNSEYNLPGNMIQAYASATLDGKTLASGYLSEDNPNALPISSTIAAESEGPGQLVFKLPVTEGVVDLVLRVDSIDYSEVVEILSESINLANVETVVSESEYEVVINEIAFTDDGEGKDLVVLDISFTNNSRGATSFGYTISIELFQNGIELKSGWLPYKHPLRNDELSSNTFTDIKQGASINIQLVYELYDTSNPVEIICVDTSSYDYATIIHETVRIAGTQN